MNFKGTTYFFWKIYSYGCFLNKTWLHSRGTINSLSLREMISYPKLRPCDVSQFANEHISSFMALNMSVVNLVLIEILE